MIPADYLNYLSKFIRNKKLSSTEWRAIYKSVLLRQKFVADVPGSNPQHIKMSLILLYRVINIYIKFLLAPLVKSGANSVFVFNYGTAPQMRKEHVQTYTDIGHENIEFITNSKYLTNGRKNYLLSYKIFKSVICAIFKNTFSASKNDYSWITQSFRDSLQLSVLNSTNCNTKVYFYLSMSTYAYTSCFISSEIFKLNTNFIAGNTPLFRPFRYTYLPGSTVVLCSRFQEDEIEQYISLGWIIVNNVILWGLQENIQIGKNDNEALIDVLICSSAEWCRKENYWRETDIECIKRGDPLKRTPYSVFKNIVLEAVIQLKNKYPRLNIVLMPHPYERKLIEEYNLQPPYLQQLKEKDIHFINVGKYSTNYVLSSKIIVASCSTIVFDAWHLNKVAYAFSGYGMEEKFNTDYNIYYLGKYKKYFYNSTIDLENAIISDLKLAVA